MIIRKAALDDLKSIADIFANARKFLSEQKIDQWQGDYPRRIDAADDIENGCCYVMEIGGDIAMCMALVFGDEPTYKNIYQGGWLTNGEYGVIHRIAASDKFRGNTHASDMFDFAGAEALKRNINSLRIDTHKDNKPMLKALSKAGFEYCGIIYVEDNTQRLAFEKILKQ